MGEGVLRGRLGQQRRGVGGGVGMTPSARTRSGVDMPSAVTDKSRFFGTGA